MNVTIRKLVVGCVALAALVGVYWLYTRTGQAPHVAANLAQTLPAPAVHAQASSPNDVGMIGGVGIGRVEQTRFLHRNERNEVDREFGFVQLLHKVGNQWEITDPYLKLFLPTFRCTVTADRGKVQVDSTFSRLVANDAQFSGNVVIHIVPAEPNEALECFIHLDEVGFLAAKSLFSSRGSVEFLSRRAQLTGTGLELLYDEGRSRLEMFRIFDLKSLRLRSRDLGSVADLTPSQHTTSTASSQDLLVRETPDGSKSEPQPGDRYQCIFRRNVAIETPDRMIRAKDLLAIDNILWAGSEKNVTAREARRTDGAAQETVEPNEAEAIPYPGPDALDTTASSHLAMRAIPPEFFDTVVTCEGGFEITPMGARQRTEDGGQKTDDKGPVAKDSAPSSVLRPPSSGSVDRQSVVARRIHFNAFTTDTALGGPVEMAFPLDPNGLPEARPGTAAMPMTIAARDSVRFLAAANQVLFDGDCRVTLSRPEPNAVQEYTLTAPRLVLDLVADPNGPKGQTVRARKLATDGGPAALRILRRGPDKLLGWTKLDAAQLLCEADLRQFTAAGPGEIWVRNDEFLNAKADPNQFSLGRPCVVRLTNFDTLRYSTATNRIIAEDEAQQLLLDYFALTAGQYDGRHTRAVAGHVEASLREIVPGRLELVSLAATQGIEYGYEDATRGLSFVGSSLLYDYAQSLVAVRGDAQQPCYLNGALVDQIDLNLKTGRIQAEIPAPSVVQVRQ